MTYRKLFGLSSYIGLAQRDRFELSGEDLQDWLQNPSNGKAILTRHLGASPLPSDLATQDDSSTLDNQPPVSKEVEDPSRSQRTTNSSQLGLISRGEPTEPSEQLVIDDYLSRMPKVKSIQISELATAHSDVIVLGMGFEDRTLESTRRILEYANPSDAVLIRYPNAGHGDDIERLCRDHIQDQSRIHIVEYQDFAKSSLALPEGQVLVDVTEVDPVFRTGG